VSGNGIVENALELLGEAVRLKQAVQGDAVVTAVLIGHQLSAYTDDAARYGADRIILAEDARLAVYRPDYYTDVLTEIARTYAPDILLLGATAIGEELGPSAAARLKTGMAAHCVGLSFKEGAFVQVVPAFGGKVLGDILCPEKRPQMASMKSGIVAKIEPQEIKAEIEHFQADIQGFGDRMRIQSIQEHQAETAQIGNASVIVAGGFGIGSQEGWDKLEKLAVRLGGVTGCTRPALDEGWTDREHTMIGTSGVAVGPKVYLGFGISGAAHHTCGIKSADVVISVNRDAAAPIFEVSDYSVVADWETIVDALLKALA
jgi:electron transfer flavoprotein alpha subunit